MIYQFDTDVAAVYGVDESIMIFNLEYWIRKNEANEKHFHDGRYWTYNSIKAFTKLFPFWTSRQIQRVLKSLEDKGVIVTGNYNTSTYDRTTWYAFSDNYLNREMHLTKTLNGENETGQSNKSIYTQEDDIITNDKPNGNAAGGGLFPAPVEQEETHKGTTERLCLFANSKYNRFEDFAAQFMAPEYTGIDIAYYYGVVSDWSASHAKKRNDWIATTRNVMRRDMSENKLHRVVQAQQGTASHLDADDLAYLNMCND